MSSKLIINNDGANNSAYTIINDNLNSFHFHDVFLIDKGYLIIYNKGTRNTLVI